MHQESSFDDDSPRVVQVFARNIKACVETASPEDCMMFARAIHAIAATVAPGQDLRVTFKISAWHGDEAITTLFEVRYRVYSSSYIVNFYPQDGHFDYEAVKSDVWPLTER